MWTDRKMQAVIPISDIHVGRVGGCRQADRVTGIQEGKQAGRQTCRQGDRQADRQRGRQTDCRLT